MSVNGMTAVLARGPEILCSRLSQPARNLRAKGPSARESQRPLKAIRKCREVIAVAFYRKYATERCFFLNTGGYGGSWGEAFGVGKKTFQAIMSALPLTTDHFRIGADVHT